MSQPEKPLHVRVAEVLGPFVEYRKFGSWGSWVGAMRTDDFEPIPHYDTSWSAAGPLIEKYGINLSFINDRAWEATRYNGDDGCEGPTPLLAVCNLIVSAPHISLDTSGPE